MIREHYVPKDAKRCIHCSAPANTIGPEVTCVPREGNPGSGMRPEPARRVLAHEDPSIAGRIAELEKERQDGWNRSE